MKVGIASAVGLFIGTTAPEHWRPLRPAGYPLYMRVTEPAWLLAMPFGLLA